MAKFLVEVTQWFRVSRSIKLEIEASTLQEAIAKQENEGDLPSFDDPRWETDEELTDEQVYSA
jgi:hypothetical protein